MKKKGGKTKIMVIIVIILTILLITIYFKPSPPTVQVIKEPIKETPKAKTLSTDKEDNGFLEITCPSFDVLSGETTKKEFTITNKDLKGTFGYFFDCDKGENKFEPPSPKPLMGGETLIIEGYFFLLEGCSDCEFKVNNINKPLHNISCPFYHCSIPK